MHKWTRDVKVIGPILHLGGYYYQSTFQLTFNHRNAIFAILKMFLSEWVYHHSKANRNANHIYHIPRTKKWEVNKNLSQTAEFQQFFNGKHSFSYRLPCFWMKTVSCIFERLLTLMGYSNHTRCVKKVSQHAACSAALLYNSTQRRVQTSTTNTCSMAVVEYRRLMVWLGQ